MTEARSSSRRTWLLIIIAFSLFWVAWLMLFAPKPVQPKLADTGSSEPASYNWTILDLHDRPVPFSQFKGKTIFLNFWATWCAPCLKEMPSIARLAAEPKLRDKGIVFLCVASDETSEPVRQYLEGRDWPMSFYRTDRVPGAFYSQGLPATFIVSPNGRIAAVVEGGDDWDKPEVIALLEKLAGERPSSP